MSRLKIEYEPRVVSARAALEADRTLTELLARRLPPVLFEFFLIEWFTRLPYLHKPTARWYERAAMACNARGLEEIGSSFTTLSRHEDGQDPLCIADARALAKSMEARRGVEIDIDALLADRPTISMRAFRVLHSEVLAADLPVGCAAIGYEIERATTALSIALVLQAQRFLGAEVCGRLSWLRRRSTLGVARTAEYATTLEQILQAVPGSAQPLGEIGAGAIDIYAHFLRECMNAAKERVRTMNVEWPVSSRRPRDSCPSPIPS